MAMVSILILPVGCAKESGPANSGANFPHTISSLEAYPAALLEGNLSIEKSGDAYCPRVETAQGDNYLLVLPPTAEVKAESIAVFGKVYATGDVVFSGGDLNIDFDDAGCSSNSGKWLAGP
ncbi:hypothetical protein [Rarobacter faecitabidus]|nr:hypothetical protein [Rarobacter faecitabidus]